MSPAEAALSRVASRPRPVGEMVAKKIIAIRPADFHIAGVLQRGGFGYLKAKIKSFNESAKSQAFFVLTDLDNAPCAPALTESWLPKPQHANLIFRVAVREVEAWLLADRTAIAGFLGVKESAVPSDVESLPYPKRALIDLARRSRFAWVKSALVPRVGSTAKIGPDYNACLSQFVLHHWNQEEAARTSKSLRQALRQVRSFRMS